MRCCASRGASIEIKIFSHCSKTQSSLLPLHTLAWFSIPTSYVLLLIIFPTSWYDTILCLINCIFFVLGSRSFYSALVVKILTQGTWCPIIIAGSAVYWNVLKYRHPSLNAYSLLRIMSRGKKNLKKLTLLFAYSLVRPIFLLFQ